MKYFIDFFTGPYAWRLIRNTLLLNILQIILAFPVPIILALLINDTVPPLQEAGANGQLYASLHIACRHVQPAPDVQPFGWNF